MWLTQLAIVACLLVGKGYGSSRTPPTRVPTTQPTLVTVPTQPQDLSVIPQGGCLHDLLTAPIIQSERRYLVTTGRGQNRLSLLKKFPNTLAPQNSTSVAASTSDEPSDADRDLPIAVITSEQAENISANEVVEEDMPICDDDLSGSDPDPGSSRGKRSFDPNELTWNIDRLDERSLPLDGEFCPAADGTGVDVYILDTGINYNHKVFNGRASFGGYDAFNGDGSDCQGHGTHCAGLAVGYLTGCAYGARVYSIRVLNCQLAGYFSYVIAGINHVILRARQTGRRSVISMSLIGPKTTAVDVAIREAVANNIVVVTAAGNFRKNSCNYSPSSSPDVINVGGTQQAEDEGRSGHMLYWFNSRSTSPGTNYGRCVHIFAHGQWIRSASHTSNTERRSLSGTSMACPTVAGVVATLLQRFPNYTPRQIKDQLIKESIPGAVNMKTYRGSTLASVISAETPNRFSYAGRCNNRPESNTQPPTSSTTTAPPSTPAPIRVCHFGGLPYNDGDTFNPDCTTKCKCNKGTLQCQPKRCYTDTCQAYTNGHYLTFDGTSFNYNGTCEYVLVTPCNNDDYTISVVQAQHDSDVVEISQVVISLQGERIVMSRKKPVVTINGEKLDRFDGNTMTVGEVLVQWIGNNLYATFEDTGFNIFWDGLGSIQVSVSNKLKKQLCGLCGFYNSNNNDDLRMRDGSVTTDTDDFALSWLHGNGNTRRNCQPAAPESTCGTKPLRQATETCNVLNSAPFTSCHSKVNREPYVANCKRDFCDCSRTSRDQRDACACKVIASYARACAQAGVDMDNWISSTRCTSGCAGFRVYKDCASFCQPTCSNRSPPRCNKECASGCFCRDGQVLKGGTCVDPNTCDDKPKCKGICLPSRKPIYFERFYRSEVDDLINDAKRFNVVPTQITVYRDDQDMLFSTVFSRVDNASACTILTSATAKDITQASKKLKKTHQLVTVACYQDGSNKRCIAVFCPKKQKCGSGGNRKLPSMVCNFCQKYNSYQNTLLKRYSQGYRVIQRKIHLEGTNLLVDVCYQKGIIVSLHDSLDLSNLIQTIERNEQRGLYLTDGNARMDGSKMIFSAVFTDRKYGKCDYRVLYNLDALQLYERERLLNQDGYHITAIIPTTGELTPLFIAVFWR